MEQNIDSISLVSSKLIINIIFSIYSTPITLTLYIYKGYFGPYTGARPKGS
jgi:hypothetical protein